MREVNPVIGEWTCPLGGAASVYQTKKHGRHFYTKCECCGLNQGTKKVRQQKIYDETRFIEGVTFEVPSNVKGGGPKLLPSRDAIPGFDPNQVDESSEHSSDESSEPSLSRSLGDRLRSAAPLAVLAIAMGVGAWMN